MKLVPIAANLTKLEYPDRTVFYSYQTPVAVEYSKHWDTIPAAQQPKDYRTNAFFSVTTSRHLSKIGAKHWQQVSQEELEKMASGQEGGAA